MIAVKLEGRLGNQLFQYAFAYAAAKKLGTRFYLDKSIAEFMPAKYFNLKPDFLQSLDASIFSVKGYKNLFSIKLKQTFYKQLRKLFFGSKTINIDNHQPVTVALSQLQNHHLYLGYFQSETYFRDIKTEIKQVLNIKENYTNAFKDLAKQLPSHQKKNSCTYTSWRLCWA